jgi:hypothetical protein
VGDGGATAGNVKLLLPPRQSRGISFVSLAKYTHPTSELRIACLGVFDTVGALGIPTSAFTRYNRQKHDFHDVSLSPIVKLNLHAVAIDEKRPQFEASVWRQNRFKVSNSVTEQTWFSGVHSDIGGGYYNSYERSLSNVRGLDDITLDWIIKRIKHHYPDFSILDWSFPRILSSLDLFGLQHNSRTWKYCLSRPAVRAIGNMLPPLLENEIAVSHDRNSSVVGESIHVSALERLAINAPVGRLSTEGIYLPRNLIVNFANLYARYCGAMNMPFPPNAVSITSWSGEIVDPQGDEEGALGEIRGVLTAAYDRLTKLGYDVLSTSWTSYRATRRLAASKRA